MTEDDWGQAISMLHAATYAHTVAAALSMRAVSDLIVPGKLN